jgi:hypothetical protein
MYCQPQQPNLIHMPTSASRDGSNNFRTLIFPNFFQPLPKPKTLSPSKSLRYTLYTIPSTNPIGPIPFEKRLGKIGKHSSSEKRCQVSLALASKNQPVGLKRKTIRRARSLTAPALAEAISCQWAGALGRLVCWDRWCLLACDAVFGRWSSLLSSRAEA